MATTESVTQTFCGPDQASGQPRTDKNFPVVPDKIVQTAYLLSVGYAFNDKWRAYVTVPYLEQATDHISIVPNYNTFNLKTSGVGDTLVSDQLQVGLTRRYQICGLQLGSAFLRALSTNRETRLELLATSSSPTLCN